jgi:hypothetical protein
MWAPVEVRAFAGGAVRWQASRARPQAHGAAFPFAERTLAAPRITNSADPLGEGVTEQRNDVVQESVAVGRGDTLSLVV